MSIFENLGQAPPVLSKIMLRQNARLCTYAKNCKGKDLNLIFQRLDQSGRDFMKYILQIDVDEQRTMKDMLEHPWLSDYRNGKKMPGSSFNEIFGHK